MSLETAIRKALERVGPGADPEQRARVYQSARMALENGLRQQNITDAAVASEQRRQLEAAINRVERDAKLDYMEHESRQRAAREAAEREARRKREIEMAEQARIEAEQARERNERAREQAERDAEMRRRREEIDRERVARELEYEAAQRALRERIAAREQAARERALQEREQMLAAERQEEEARRLAEDARRHAAEQAEREAEARRKALEEQAEREEAIRAQAERERLAREQAAREFAEQQAAEREREARERGQRAQEEAARQAAERERFVREEAERRVAEEEARRAAEAERARLMEARATEEADRLEQQASAAAIGGMVRHEDVVSRDMAPSLDAPEVELEGRDGPREPVFDIMPEVEHRAERRVPSFDIETPEPALAARQEPEAQPDVIHLPPERAIKPRRKSRWKARAFAVITLAAFGAAGWWWVESTGLTLPKAVRDGSVPNPPPSVKEEDFDGAKQLKSLSRQGGYGDEWTKLFEAGKSKSFTVGSQATAKVEQSGSGPYLAITSAAPGLDGSVTIELPQDVIASMQGKTSNIALMLEGGDKPVQVTVECEFGGLGNCGRHRFLLSQNKTDLMFDVQVKAGGAAEGPGRLVINADAGGEGNTAKLFSIHVLPNG